MSIFEYLADHQGSGLGLALINDEDDVVRPYIDPSDYPTFTVNSHGRSTDPDYTGWWVCAHDGILELDPHFFSSD